MAMQKTTPASGKWTTPGSSSALCVLCLDDKKGNVHRPALPPSLYNTMIAPYLRFGDPVPGQLYALGGRNGQEGALATVEMFDTWHGEWVSCPSMLSRRAGCAGAALPDGRLLVTGGYDERGHVEGTLGKCEVFDPKLQRWESFPSLFFGRWGHGCAVLRSCVYVVGGCFLPEDEFPHENLEETMRSCEVYDFSRGQWSHSAELNVARAGARVVALGDRCLLAFGGCDSVSALASVELYDPETNCWTLLDTEMLSERSAAACAVLDGESVLVAGGYPSLSSTEIFRVTEGADVASATSATTHLAHDTVKRLGGQAATISLPAFDGEYPHCDRTCVVIAGGVDGEEPDATQRFVDARVYDIVDHEWRPEGSFPCVPTPRTAMALVVGPGCLCGHP